MSATVPTRVPTSGWVIQEISGYALIGGELFADVRVMNASGRSRPLGLVGCDLIEVSE
jgi:hypothetical protein